ncbi:MAG: 3D domain-containing protein, partial [Clostridiaceae bacterium]|nr:3D domain-containing protein [Clostridiaceae bacterium]
LKSNVTQILKTNNIALGAKDQITVSLDSKVKDGDKIYIKKAVDVKLTVDGKELNLKTAEGTVEDMLRAEKIVLNNEDKITPSKSTLLKSGIQVQITRVKTKILEETKTIDFATEFKKSSDLNKGVKKVIQKGQTGQKLITSAIVYENGKESSRKLISEELKSNPVKEIIALGTVSVYSSSRGGDISYTEKISVRATAYNADYQSTGKNPGDPAFGITCTGATATRNTSGFSTVAVDPRVIPLGTKMYIEGYGYGIAEDVGGAIKGNRIDLFYNTRSESMNWGSRNVNVYVLK